MSYALTEEQELIQQNAREFAIEYVEGAVRTMEETEAYPEALVQQMIEQDFLGIFLPDEYGGADAGFLSYSLIIEELSRVSGATASILIQHAAMAAYSIYAVGTTEQKKKYLPDLCQGKKMGSFAFCESGAAPGAGKEKVTAVKDGDLYILQGKKYYVGNAGFAGLYIVFAQTDPEAGHKGMSAFIVDADTAGIKVERMISCMGLKGFPHAEVSFENVKVPAANLLGVQGDGFAVAEKAQAAGSIAEGAMVLGIAKAAMDDAIKYGKQRIQFHRPISSFPAIQKMFADMAANIHMLRLAVYDAANLVDQGADFTAEAAMIKLLANRIGQNTLTDVVQIEGGYGYSQEMPASRFFRDIRGAMRQSSSLDFPERIIAGHVLN